MTTDYNLTALSAAQQAWRMLWDRGKESTKKKKERQNNYTKATTNRRSKRNQQQKQPKQHQQTTMNGENLALQDAEAYGDTQQAKREPRTVAPPRAISSSTTWYTKATIVS